MASGQRVTPALLRRLRPAYYVAEASADLPGAVTQALIPGASVTFTTETAGAEWYVDAVFDADVVTAPSTALALGYCEVDGVTQTGQATCGDEVVTDRHTVTQQWSGVFAAAGSHTIRLRGTLAANQQFRVGNTRLRVTVKEVV
jgi:hypothetical protein